MFHVANVKVAVITGFIVDVHIADNPSSSCAKESAQCIDNEGPKADGRYNVYRCYVSYSASLKY